MTYKFLFIILGISLISCQSDNSKSDNNLSLGGFNYQDDVVIFYTSDIVDQVQFKVRINDKVRFSSYYCNANDYIMFDEYENHTCSEWVTDWDPREYTKDGNVINFDGGSITFLSKTRISVTFTGIKQSPHLMDTKGEVKEPMVEKVDMWINSNYFDEAISFLRTQNLDDDLVKEQMKRVWWHCGMYWNTESMNTNINREESDKRFAKSVDCLLEILEFDDQGWYAKDARERLADNIYYRELLIGELDQDVMDRISQFGIQKKEVVTF